MPSDPLSGGNTGPGDQELMRRIRCDDEYALDGLIQRYWTPLVRYATGFVHDEDPAEDIVQGTFVRVWRKRHDWQAKGTVSGYLYSIVRNLCLHERDRRRVRKEWADHEALWLRCSPSPAEDLRKRELLGRLEKAIDALPDRRREVFTLACLHGLSYREVAETLGIAIPTVANQMSAAFKDLRETLQPALEQIN